MTSKSQIVERLGEKAVLLPSLLGEALAANDRIKLRLSGLQEALAQARQPRVPNENSVPSIASGDAALAELVKHAQMIGTDRLYLPGVNALLTALREDLGTMLAPLEASNPEGSLSFHSRLDSLRAMISNTEGDQLETRIIGELTAANRDERDSVHLLVMDMHKALLRLATESAAETLDGAQVHSLEARDRVAVSAFMKGLHRTAPLAFGHPGLGTIAVRSGNRLVIQNDIGVTDAHVLVIHVENNQVTITYTDIHRPRAKFFVEMFAGENVAWGALSEQQSHGIGEEDIFYLVAGTYRGASDEEIDRFLSFLGSRIVFLIDWNKARKALQTFVGRGASFDLLQWAAKQEYGHRAFLVLGGVELIFEAVHRVAEGRISYGVRLDEAIGVAECVDFLQRVLRDTSQGLTAGRTARLIRDEIQADLSRRFESTESSVLTVLVRHLGLSRSLAAGIAEVLRCASQAQRRDFASRAKRMEEKADRLTVAARELAIRVNGSVILRRAIDEIENTSDELEDCAYFLSLVPEEDMTSVSIAPLLRLAETTTESVSQMARAVEAASRLPDGQRADAIASLQAIDAVAVAEREADTAERESFAAFIAAPEGRARALLLAIEIVRKLERATDHLSHAAFSLRDRVMEELSA
ncbi:MAG TPA: hypothetical protein VG328_06310 [Stellaceae bacterium]|jgi:uncharacterized protein Yka (UPF0111/DUF47 family)|nr:hypothetical protein [Stellaceae bacterium]